MSLKSSLSQLFNFGGEAVSLTLKTVFFYLWRFGVMALFAAAAYWWIFLPRQILTTGERGRAVVLDVWETSTSVNDAPLLGIRLDVRTSSGETFEVNKYCRYSYGDEWIFVPGARMEVRYSHIIVTRVMLPEADCDSDGMSMAAIGLTVVGLNVFFWVMLPVIGSIVAGFRGLRGDTAPPEVKPVPALPKSPDLGVVKNRKASSVERLLNLDDLREKKLINEEEYSQLREQILKSI